MTDAPPEKDRRTDFQAKSTMWVAIAALFILTPFSINNFVQGRPVLGVTSLTFVGILALGAWTNRRGQHYPLLTFAGLVAPAIIYLILVFRRQGIVGAFWCYPAVLSFYVMLPERMAWVANTAFLCLVLPEAWRVLDFPLAARVTATVIAVSVFSIIFVRVITSQRRLLEEQAVTDPLTGLSNRKLLPTTLEKAHLEGRRTKAPMTLLSLDLDHFKKINDTLGHDAGDKVLREVAAVFRNRLRRIDPQFRIGGEEFLILLRNSDGENGLRVAEELRTTIGSLPILTNRRITASIGVATLQTDENWMEWLKRCDDNLYRAKSAGRNCVIMD